MKTRMKMVMALVLSVVLMVTLLGCPNESSSGGDGGNGSDDIVATYEDLVGDWKSGTHTLTNPNDSSESYTFYYL